MRKTLFIIIFFFSLLSIAGLNSCVPTETARFNPNERVFCDISTQLNGNDNSLKSEIRFYVKDSLDSRPYFLDKPVFMNGLEMDKKFIGHKGVYYSLIHILEDTDDLQFSFMNLDDKEYEIDVPISFFSTEELDSFDLEEIAALELEEKESIILIDVKNKIFDISKKEQDLNTISLGKAQMIRVITTDSLFQLKDKLWLKYNSKSLSKTKTIEIR